MPRSHLSEIFVGVSDQRKFARYFDVEARIIPVCKESNYCLDLNKIRQNLDENTIGRLGPSWSYARDFCHSRVDLYWTLWACWRSGETSRQISRGNGNWYSDPPRWRKRRDVLSIRYSKRQIRVWNSSRQKYQYVFLLRRTCLTVAPVTNTVSSTRVSDGLFSVMKNSFRNISNSNSIISAVWAQLLYLTKGTEETYTLNFSRPGNQVIAQYFSFIRLGSKGYKAIARQDLANARLLSNALEATGCTTPFP